MLVDIIAGTRPNFVKIASILHAIEADNEAAKILEVRLVHTGQHYDERMSGDFFEQLRIKQPNINLGVGSGSQAEQTGKIMIGYEQVLLNDPSELCIVVGDVNSTMACAIVAKKFNIPVAHIEGGIRSCDSSMPEEINRIVTDSISDLFFTTSEYANKNLISEGVSTDKIFFVGNTMIDTLLNNIGNLKRPELLDQHSINRNKYFTLTLHRPNNVDDHNNLNEILQIICHCNIDVPVIFPVHPRTEKVLKKLHKIPSNLIITAPLPYLEFIWLVKNSIAVLTDSGGITEETTVLGVPCLTLRETTERPETVDIGTNELVGMDADLIRFNMEKILSGEGKRGSIPERWDGKTGERIIRILKNKVCPAK